MKYVENYCNSMLCKHAIMIRTTTRVKSKFRCKALESVKKLNECRNAYHYIVAYNILFTTKYNYVCICTVIHTFRLFHICASFPVCCRQNISITTIHPLDVALSLLQWNGAFWLVLFRWVKKCVLKLKQSFIINVRNLYNNNSWSE